jgi:predicted lysophospholipase L1 biosynthesis ABC-type transport system permease subunit
MNRLPDLIFGPPPARGAERADQLRWARRFYTRSGLPITLALFVLVVAFGASGAIVIVLSVCVAVEILGLLAISTQIRRADRKRARDRPR